jgi:hypothetical protein
MFTRATIPLALAAAMLVAPMRLPAPACILTNMPSEKACSAQCCANKACCQTSQKRTSPPLQPLATVGLQQQNIAALPAVIAVTEVPGLSIDRSGTSLSLKTSTSHPPTLALICIRLI